MGLKKTETRVVVNILRGCGCWEKHRTAKERLQCSYPDAQIMFGTGKYAVLFNHRDYDGLLAHMYTTLEEAEIAYSSARKTSLVEAVEVWYLSSRNAAN